MYVIKCITISFLLICLIFSCKKTDPPNNNIQPANYRLNISGVVKTCNGNNLTNGYIVLLSNNGYLSMNVTNGIYDTILESSIQNFDSLQIWAIDLDSLKTSDTLFIAVNNDSMQLPQINACYTNADEFINCRIDNERYAYVPAFIDSLRVAAWDTLNAPTTYIYRSDNRFIQNPFYRMQFAGMSAGTFNFNWNSSFQIGRYYTFNMPPNNYINYTRYGNVGEYIEGNIYANFIDNTDSLQHLMTGVFKIRRDF